MRRENKRFAVYERMPRPAGFEPEDEFRGYIDAWNEEAALNKARRWFKFERSGGEYGAYTRRIKAENLFIK